MGWRIEQAGSGAGDPLGERYAPKLEHNGRRRPSQRLWHRGTVTDKTQVHFPRHVPIPEQANEIMTIV